MPRRISQRIRESRSAISIFCFTRDSFASPLGRKLFERPRIIPVPNPLERGTCSLAALPSPPLCPPPLQINYALLIFVRDTRPETISPCIIPAFLPPSGGSDVVLFINRSTIIPGNRTVTFRVIVTFRFVHDTTDGQSHVQERGSDTSNASLVESCLNRPSLFRVSSSPLPSPRGNVSSNAWKFSNCLPPITLVEISDGAIVSSRMARFLLNDPESIIGEKYSSLVRNRG